MIGFPGKPAAPAAGVAAALLVALAIGAAPAAAELVPCPRPADTGRIAAALARIRRAVDPCGGSGEIRDVLARLARCHRTATAVCTSTQAFRNEFARGAPNARRRTAIVTWNPRLRAPLMGVCATDPARVVTRDPTASLLHELVHAVHDCEGLDAGRLEAEAVRIENVYRRAAGLCQRTQYGPEPVPAAAVTDCSGLRPPDAVAADGDDRSGGPGDAEPASATLGAEVLPVAVVAEEGGAVAADGGVVRDGGAPEHAGAPLGLDRDRLVADRAVDP